MSKAEYLMHSRLRGFQERVDRAKRIIREAEGKGRSVFSISWGKDSAAMLGLALEICDRITVLHISDPAALPGWAAGAMVMSVGVCPA